MSKIVQIKDFRVKESLVDSARLVFVFTAMGTRLGAYGWFIRSLNKRGYSVVAYDYPARLVLDAEFDSYERLYSDIKNDAHKRTQSLKPKHVYAYGVSMGTVLAHKLTQDTQAIHHVAMSLPYGDMVTNIMHSPATRKTRKTMQAKGLTVDDLRAAVKFFDPIQNAKGLQDKKVWLHLSRPDRILDYKVTSKTKEAFEANIQDLTYTESKRLGHYGAGIKHMLNVKELDAFYKS
ncbi:MAG TPA: hypothetical protein VK674_06560 [Candidatus Limnocylindria bacterium]|nr:hypothetical protein [Candidatus Limnocylindria bacterium]